MKTIKDVSKTATWFELTNGYCGVMNVPDDCEWPDEYIERRAKSKFHPSDDLGVKDYRDAKPEDIAYFEAMGGYLA